MGLGFGGEGGGGLFEVFLHVVESLLFKQAFVGISEYGLAIMVYLNRNYIRRNKTSDGIGEQVRITEIEFRRLALSSFRLSGFWVAWVRVEGLGWTEL